MDSLIVKQSRNGKGVFANKNFKKGDFIIEFRGKIYSKKDNPRGFYSKKNYFMQIGEDKYIGPCRTPDNYINHSCNPNSAVKIGDKILLFAIKDIKKGEEITFDYSTTMTAITNNWLWEEDCNCGNKNCRKKIKDFEYLPKKTQQKYIKLGIVPKYILRNLSLK